MDSKVKLYLERAENELRFAKETFNLSGKENLKIELGANPEDTFYSAVISHSYYAIFYSAKAILLTKGINTKSPEKESQEASEDLKKSPEEHRKTYEKFKKIFVDSGELDNKLLRIYNDLIVKADELLSLFAHEKWKRGYFTYKILAQANIEPAKESIQNTIKLLSNIKQVLETWKIL